MFKKLRNRFLLLNLVIISVMMLIAFASIYTITYQNVRADIMMDLNRIADFYNKGPKDQQPGKGGAGGGGGGHLQQLGPDENRGAPPQEERSFSFTVVTDAQWGIKTVSSFFTLDEAFYGQAVQAAVSEKKDKGQLSLEGNEWAYEIHPATEGYRFVFLDVTARQSILTNLVYTFIVVGIVMLVVIFFISRFFANRSIAPVQEAFDKQKQFIADASHELKTPLAIINTNVDVLLSNEEDTIRNQSKWLRYIQSETERMSKLTGDLLYLTQMEEGRESALFSPFHASEAVENVILTMEAVIFEKEITLEYDIEPDIFVRGSSEQLKQVAMILLDNAIKYTNPRGSINLKLKRQNQEMKLSVTNTGEGIAPEHLERIFDRFYRTDASRTRELGGYGLGLSIAKAIVEQHKGRIYAKSTPKEKTTFSVHLPLASSS